MDYFVSFFRAAKSSQHSDERMFENELPADKSSTSRGRVEPNIPKKTLCHTLSATNNYFELDSPQQGT